MNRGDFTKASPGELIKNLDGNWTFLPHPLPAKFEWTNELVLAVTSAERSLGRLFGLGRKLPNPQRLVRMFLRREAELSSRIENTIARVQTMVLFEHLPGVINESPAVSEVGNNFKALEFAIEAIEHQALTPWLIRQTHAILLKDVRGQDMTPGQFRTIQAHIGRSRDIKQARFVPCPPHAIEPAMESLGAYLKKSDGLPSVVRAAMVHYQFETIHPFADGNGRVGRVLLLLQLLKEGVLPAPLLNPSARLEMHRQKYYDRLLGVSLRGEWVDWLVFFCQSISEEAIDAANRIEKLEALREEYYTLVRGKRASALPTRLVDELFVNPSATIRQVATNLSIRFSWARQLLNKLADVGIVREVTGRKRDRVFLAQGIIDLFTTDPIDVETKEVNDR